MPHTREPLVCLGAVAAAHGVKGLVKIKSFTERPEDVAAYGPLTDAEGKHRFQLTIKGRAGDLLLAAVEGIATREAAEGLCGTALYVRRAALPAPDGDQLYRSDLEGLAAVRNDGMRVGTVERVLDYGAGAVLQIRLAGGGELLLPFAERFVPQVDLAGGRLVVDPPEEVEAAQPEERSDDQP